MPTDDKRPSQPWVQSRQIVKCASVEIEHVSGGNVWLTFRDEQERPIKTMSLPSQKGS